MIGSLSCLFKILHKLPANYIISSVFYPYKFLRLITPVSLLFYVVIIALPLSLLLPITINLIPLAAISNDNAFFYTVIFHPLKLLSFISYANHYT